MHCVQYISLQVDNLKIIIMDKNSFIFPIGKGVFTQKSFTKLKGDFLLEYRGELITSDEAEHREKMYSEEHGSFLFYFEWKDKTYWYYLSLHANLSFCAGTSSTQMLKFLSFDLLINDSYC